jgi:hypothetical protein
MESWLLAVSVAYVDRTHKFYLQLGSCLDSTECELAEQGAEAADPHPMSRSMRRESSHPLGRVVRIEREAAVPLAVSGGGSPSPTPADAADYTAGAESVRAERVPPE